MSELSTLPKYSIGDHQRLMQATANLIQNAIQFQTNNGSVIVIVAFDNQEQKLVVIVSDTGMGMASSQKEDIFKMSQHVPRIQVDGNLSQVDLKDNRTIGLGLYVSKQII